MNGMKKLQISLVVILILLCISITLSFVGAEVENQAIEIYADMLETEWDEDKWNQYDDKIDFVQTIYAISGGMIFLSTALIGTITIKIVTLKELN